MNFLKIRNPFKFLTNFFRLATRSTGATDNETLIEPKRNKSEMTLKKQPISIESSQKSTTSIGECQNIERKPTETQLTRADSISSLHQSKTSSEHSFKGAMVRKKNVLNFQAAYEEPNCTPLDKELRRKINQLQASFNPSKSSTVEKNRQRLKRAYPWQNFNLHNISQMKSDFAKRTSSEISLTSNNSSIVSLVSSEQQSKTNVNETQNQVPLFKSMLHKSASVNPKPSVLHKKVAFNNIATIYGPRKTPSKKLNHLEKNREEMEKSKEEMKKYVCKCLGRCEPLKEEYSFMSLYANKRPRTKL